MIVSPAAPGSKTAQLRVSISRNGAEPDGAAIRQFVKSTKRVTAFTQNRTRVDFVLPLLLGSKRALLRGESGVPPNIVRQKCYYETGRKLFQKLHKNADFLLIHGLKRLKSARIAENKPVPPPVFGRNFAGTLAFFPRKWYVYEGVLRPFLARRYQKARVARHLLRQNSNYVIK